MKRTRITDLHQALARCDEMLEQYEPKHQGAWARQTIGYHVSHGSTHLDNIRHLRGTASCDNDLTSAALRCLFALELSLRQDEV